jgi:hypothetical protein
MVNLRLAEENGRNSEMNLLRSHSVHSKSHMNAPSIELLLFYSEKPLPSCLHCGRAFSPCYTVLQVQAKEGHPMPTFCPPRIKQYSHWNLLPEI